MGAQARSVSLTLAIGPRLRPVLLKRLDYTTDVLGGVAALYCYDTMAFDGIIIPTLRRVVRRTPDGPLLSGRTSFLLDYVDVAVRR